MPFAQEYAAHAVQGPYNALYDRPAVLRLAEPVTGRTMRGRSRCSSCRSVRRLAGLDGQWLVFLHG